MKTVVFLLVFLISNISYANCKNSVTFLEKGQEAPCDGFLFTPEKEKDVRYLDLSVNYYKTLTSKQNEVIEIMDKRITNLQEHNNLLSDELNKKEKAVFLQSTLYFVLGIAVTKFAYDNVRN
jgi:predicted DNA-binding ArsR family transcriptional regulator